MARGLDGANIRSRQEISAGDMWNCPIDWDKTKRAIRRHERKRQGNRRCCSRIQDRRKVPEGEKTDGVESQAHSGSEDIHHEDRTQGYNILERAATRARNKYKNGGRWWTAGRAGKRKSVLPRSAIPPSYKYTSLFVFLCSKCQLWIYLPYRKYFQTFVNNTFTIYVLHIMHFN